MITTTLRTVIAMIRHMFGLTAEIPANTPADLRKSPVGAAWGTGVTLGVNAVSGRPSAIQGHITASDPCPRCGMPRADSRHEILAGGCRALTTHGPASADQASPGHASADQASLGWPGAERQLPGNQVSRGQRRPDQASPGTGRARGRRAGQARGARRAHGGALAPGTRHTATHFAPNGGQAII